MSELGNSGLVRAGKDISNPGTLGTLGMLLESSERGAVIDLETIPIPENIDFDFIHWLKLYQGCGFVITCEKKNSDDIIDKFQSVGITANTVGEITKEQKLIIKNEKKSEVLFDFESESITGI
jgi:selenophosphate synthetase-related protein